MGVKLRTLASKVLSPEELEVYNRNIFDIEAALNSVGATAGIGGGATSTPTIPGSTIFHKDLLGLGPPADDHPQFANLLGRAATQTYLARNILAADNANVWPNQSVDFALFGNAINGLSPALAFYNRSSSVNTKLAWGFFYDRNYSSPLYSFPQFGMDALGKVFIGTYSPDTNPLVDLLTLNGHIRFTGGTGGSGGGSFRNLLSTSVDFLGTGASQENYFLFKPFTNIVNNDTDGKFYYGLGIGPNTASTGRGFLQISNDNFGSEVFRLMTGRDMYLGGALNAANLYKKAQGNLLTLDFSTVNITGVLTGGGLPSLSNLAYTNVNNNFSVKQTFQGQGTTAANVLLSSGAAPTSPVAGDIWNDSTQKSLIEYANSIKQTLDGALFIQTADGTAVANSTTEATILGTGVGSLVIPANYFVAGKTLTFIIHGIYGNVLNHTLKIKSYLNAVALADTTAAALPVASTTKSFSIAVMITCRTTGATGAFQVKMITYFEGNNTHPQAVTTTTVAIDTTIAQTLDIKATWGTASATDTIKCLNAILKKGM